MNIVYKYSIDRDADGYFQLPLPLSAKPVLCAVDSGNVECIWFELDPTAHRFLRQFYIKRTGQSILSSLVHIGSYVNAPYVWHVYEAPTLEG